MNKRHLKPWVEYLLVGVLMILGGLFASISSIELSFKSISILILWVFVMYSLYNTIKKYGTGVAFDKD